MEEVKKSKKKNKVASLLLALALILTCGVAGTIAQYQKSLGGNATATVAKFDVKAGTLQSDIVDLFKNRQDTNAANGADNASGSENVSAQLIAPGTGGSVPVTLTNNSEVTVDYSVTAKLLSGGVYNDVDSSHPTVNGQTIPLEFALSDAQTIYAVQSNEWVKLKDLQTSGLGTKKSGTLKVNESTTTTSPGLKLYWRWAINDSGDATRNELDTAIGEAMADTANKSQKFTDPKVEISVQFTQKD